MVISLSSVIFTGACLFTGIEVVPQSQVLSMVPGPFQGVPPSWDWITPFPETPQKNERVSACCAANGTPLAVTQEDFLVSGVSSEKNQTVKFASLKRNPLVPTDI